jgi:hypothetical protein
VKCYVHAMVVLDLIANWWHWVDMDLMDGSVLLMWLFGWEIFLTPIAVAVGLVGSFRGSKTLDK